MKYKIMIEGQEIEMPEEIAGDDGALKSALSPYFPGAANAKFIRTEPKDNVITVTVVKQAGTKGSGDDDALQILAHLDVALPGSLTSQVLIKLIETPEGINPVVALHRSLEGRTLNQMTVDQLMGLDDQIDEIIQSGLKEKMAIDSSLALITKIAPIPSKVVVTGF
jgi:hypothetical protein